MITLALVIFLGICAFLGALVLVSNFFEWLDKKGYDDVVHMIKMFIGIMVFSFIVSFVIHNWSGVSQLSKLTNAPKVIVDCQPQGER